MTLRVPPLRERREDIPLLAKSILNAAMVAFDKRLDGFTEEALKCLQAYSWPGNVRELQNEIQRLLVFADGDRIGADRLSIHILHVAAAISSSASRRWKPGCCAKP